MIGCSDSLAANEPFLTPMDSFFYTPFVEELKTRDRHTLKRLISRLKALGTPAENEEKFGPIVLRGVGNTEGNTSNQKSNNHNNHNNNNHSSNSNNNNSSDSGRHTHKGDLNSDTSDVESLNIFGRLGEHCKLGDIPIGFEAVVVVDPELEGGVSHNNNSINGSDGNCSAAAVALHSFHSWDSVVAELVTVSKVFLKHIKGDSKSQLMTYLFPTAWQPEIVPFFYAWLTSPEVFFSWSHLWGVLFDCFCCLTIIHPLRTPVRDFVLPWQPLTDFLLAGIADSSSHFLERNCFLHFQSTLQNYDRQFSLLCDRCTQFFDAGALEGLWDYFAPRFTSCNRFSAVYLHLFGCCIPSIRTNVKGEPIPLVHEILHFLFETSRYWHTDSILWHYGKYKIISRLVTAHPGCLPLDMYAEPIFSDLLNILRLPVGDTTRRPLYNNRIAPWIDSNAIFGFSTNQLHFLMTCVAMSLPDNVTSPLWNQLRRFIHATSIFMRPNSDTKDASNVFAFYHGFISRIAYRYKYESHMKEAMAEDDHSPNDYKEARGWDLRFTKPLSMETRHTFAALFMPVVLPSLHFSWQGNQTACISALTWLDCESTFVTVVQQIERGLHNYNNTNTQGVMLRLVDSVFDVYLTEAPVHDRFIKFIRGIFPEVVQMIGGGSCFVLSGPGIVFVGKCLAQIPLNELFESSEDELELMTIFFNNLDAFSEVSNTLDARTLCAVHICMRNMSPETFSRITDKVLKHTSSLSTGHKSAFMLESIGRRDGQKVLQFIRQILMPILDTETSSNVEITLATKLLKFCFAGCGRVLCQSHEDLKMVTKCIHKLMLHATCNVHVQCATNLLRSFLRSLSQVQVSFKECKPTANGTLMTRGGRDAELMHRMNYYLSEEVEMTHDVPTPEVQLIIAKLVEDMMDDICFVVERIDEVELPSKHACNLRGLVPSSSTASSSASTPEEDRITLGEKAQPFTPHNVLVGLCSLLTTLVNFLPVGKDLSQYKQDAAEEIRVSLQPPNPMFDLQDRPGELRCTLANFPLFRLDALPTRASWSVPLPDWSSKYTPTFLLDFCVKHFLGRFAGNFRELGNVIGKDVFLFMNFDEFERALPPLEERYTKNYDHAGLDVLLGLLSKVGTPFMDQPLQSSGFHILQESCPTIFFSHMRFGESFFSFYTPVWYMELRCAALLERQTKEQIAYVPRVVYQRVVNITNLLMYVASARKITMRERLCFSGIHPLSKKLLFIRNMELLAFLAKEKLTNSEGDELATTFIKQILQGVNLSKEDELTPLMSRTIFPEEKEDEEEVDSGDGSVEEDEEAEPMHSLYEEPKIVMLDPASPNMRSVPADTNTAIIAATTTTAVAATENQNTIDDSPKLLLGENEEITEVISPTGTAPTITNSGAAAAEKTKESELKNIVERGIILLSQTLVLTSPYAHMEEYMYLLRMVLLYPDTLMKGRGGSGYKSILLELLKPISSLHVPQLTQVLEELVKFAYSFVFTAPLRSRSCLTACMHFTRVVRGLPWRKETIRLLFQLCRISTVQTLQLLACLLLSQSLLPLVERVPSSSVLLRLDMLNAANEEKNNKIFKSRYKKLCERVSRTQLSIQGISQQFPARTVTVSGVTLEENFFDDDLPMRAPEDIDTSQNTKPVYKDDRPIYNPLVESGLVLDREPYIHMIEKEMKGGVNLANHHSNDDDSVAKHAAESFIWQVAELQREGTDDPSKLLLWTVLASVLDLKDIFPTYKATLTEAMRRVDAMLSSPDTPREVLRVAFAVMVNLSASLLPLLPDLRRKKKPENEGDDEKCKQIVKSFTEVVLFCCASRVPEELTFLLNSSFELATRYMDFDDVKFLLLSLFDALCVDKRTPTSSASASSLPSRPAASNNNNNNTSTAAAISSQHCFCCIFALCKEFTPVYGGEILSLLAPLVLKEKDLFFAVPTTKLRYPAVGVIIALLSIGTAQSDLMEQNASAQAEALALLSNLESCLPLFFKPEELVEQAPPPAESYAPWGATPALTSTTAAAPPTLSPALTGRLVPSTAVVGGGVVPTMQLPEGYSGADVSSPVLSSVALPPAATELGGEPFNLDDPATLPDEKDLLFIKSFIVLLCRPSCHLLTTHALTFMRFLTRVFDISFTETGTMHEKAESVMETIMFTRMHKSTAHELISFLCNTLRGKYNIGHSRRARTILTRGLRLLIFTNLHRIGKFAMVEDIAEAALSSMSHGDGRMRTEGKLLFSVLTKVASAQQTRVLLSNFEQELKTGLGEGGALPDRTPKLAFVNGTVKEKRRHDAIVLSLCSAVLADPGYVSDYTPHLLVKLSTFLVPGKEGEIRNSVKKTFEEWWRSHRDDWEGVHKAHFTPHQIEVIAPLLCAPSYYV